MAAINVIVEKASVGYIAHLEGMEHIISLSTETIDEIIPGMKMKIRSYLDKTKAEDVPEPFRSKITLKLIGEPQVFANLMKERELVALGNASNLLKDLDGTLQGFSSMTYEGIALQILCARLSKKFVISGKGIIESSFDLTEKFIEDRNSRKDYFYFDKMLRK